MISKNIFSHTKFLPILLFASISSFSQTKKLKDITKVSKTTEKEIILKDKKSIANTLVQDTILNVIAVNDSIKIVGKATYILNQKSAGASYYADKFTGRRTASGKIFNNNAYTCAHRKLPFGTKLRVTCEKSNKSVFVVVTDRGPFVRGRHIDLSKRAFFDIAPKSYGGSIAVTIEIVK